MDIVYHYPPELLNLLIDTIPLLCRSKDDVFQFFKGADVKNRSIQNPYQQWINDKKSITNFEIVRIILNNLNDHRESSLTERREVLKRVVEFESFSSCWPEDQLKARGLVSEIRKVVNVKDSFTKMKMEKEAERKQSMEHRKAKEDAIRDKKDKIHRAHSTMLNLFSIQDAHKRGKALEDAFNSLFKAYDILIKEAFTLTGDNNEGVIEQIDGVIELNNQLYLVEVK